jgi:crotonobetainyl-CoA:carnitine CoA-transferase CaiB-like acyl-CoA transferase
MTLAAGVMAKLVERDRTGRGGLVSTSLLRTGMYSIAWDMGIQLRFGKREATRSRSDHSAPLVNSYLASDERGFYLILLEGDRHWPKLVAAIDRPDLSEDERFSSARSRMKNSEALISELDAVFAAKTMEEWAALFDEHDVWWAPIQSIVDVIADPQAQPGFVDMTPREGEDPYRAVNTPVDFDGYSFRPGPVPLLGEHTATVIDEIEASAAGEGQ